jgi:hypothetical protein
MREHWITKPGQVLPAMQRGVPYNLITKKGFSGVDVLEALITKLENEVQNVSVDNKNTSTEKVVRVRRRRVH